jgi:hypothetical protein
MTSGGWNLIEQFATASAKAAAPSAVDAPMGIT